MQQAIVHSLLITYYFKTRKLRLIQEALIQCGRLGVGFHFWFCSQDDGLNPHNASPNLQEKAIALHHPPRYPCGLAIADMFIFYSHLAPVQKYLGLAE
ncbi:MAG: hypothetical protein F6K14_28860 [Symploca sp. SIO2C1]|nr:hypothetical protein [Symploca sp. SIO2C1]